MTESTELQVLNFKNPRKPKKTKWRALSKWHQSMCTLMTESWNTLLSRKMSIKAVKVETFQCRTALLELPENAIGIHLAISQDRYPSLMVFSNRQLHGVLADILNVESEEWPEPGRFTRAEESMLGVMFQSAANAISEAIPGPEATTCVYMGMFEKPERTRLFAHVEDVFVGEISLTSRFGNETALWLLPKTETEQLIGEELHEDETEERRIHPNLVTLAQRIDVDVVIELGHCDITMSQVSQLAKGDVLILDQPINRPLTACVSGERKWLGQPMRMGSRQAFEIVQLISE